MNTTIRAFALALLTAVACGCRSHDPPDDKTPNKKADAGARIIGAGSTELPMDVHSQSRPNEVRVAHARLDLTLAMKHKHYRYTGDAMEFLANTGDGSSSCRSSRRW
jgi:hypothetical protein